MSLRFDLNVIDDNKCGDCTVCCTVYHVETLDKPARVDCLSLDTTKHKCSVYKDRPKQCKAFECSWLKGDIGNHDLGFRPDRLGLVFVMAEPPFIGVLAVDKVSPNEKLSNKAKRLLWKLEQERLFLLDGVLHGPHIEVEQWLSDHGLKED